VNAFDSRLLSLKDAAQRLGQTERWMRRHWPELVENGVKCYRVPKHAPKGRLFMEKESLQAYLEACQVKGAERL
jgi:hypothetical protein